MVSIISAANASTVITPDIEYDVLSYKMQTAVDGLPVPDNYAMVRNDATQEKRVIAITGSRYCIVDHKSLITQFAEQLDEGKHKYDVTHLVYRDGARIYSRFMLDQEYEATTSTGQTKTIRPFLTFNTSYDASTRIGFTIGALVDDVYFNVSSKLYGVSAKHMKGFKLANVLRRVEEAITAFTSKVLPAFEEMIAKDITLNDAERIIEMAVDANVISKKRAKDLNLGSQSTVYDLYKDIVETVSATSNNKRANPENGTIERNTKACEFFMKNLDALFPEND